MFIFEYKILLFEVGKIVLDYVLFFLIVILLNDKMLFNCVYDDDI